MNQNHRARIRDDLPHDHPSRDKIDHANLEPRDLPKHPRSRKDAARRGAEPRTTGRRTPPPAKRG